MAILEVRALLFDDSLAILTSAHAIFGWPIVISCYCYVAVLAAAAFASGSLCRGDSARPRVVTRSARWPLEQMGSFSAAFWGNLAARDVFSCVVCRSRRAGGLLIRLDDSCKS